MASGELVLIGMSPGIREGVLVLQIGPVPVRGSRRCRHQGLESRLLRGIAAGIELIDIEDGAQLLDLDIWAVCTRAALR